MAKHATAHAADTTRFLDRTRFARRGPGLSTVAVHGGEKSQKFGDAVTDAIYLCVDVHICEYAGGHRLHRAKATSRGIRPIRKSEPADGRTKLAALEQGEAALLFSTGMSAMVGLLMAKLTRATKSYSLTNVTIAAGNSAPSTCPRYGVVTRQVRACDYEAMEAAIARRELLVSESPTNPHLSVVDLERFVDWSPARRRNVDRRHLGHPL